MSKRGFLIFLKILTKKCQKRDFWALLVDIFKKKKKKKP